MHKIIRALVVLSVVCFILLAIFVYYVPFSSVELHISQWLQSEVDERRTFAFSLPVILISIFGNTIVAPLCVLIVAGILYVARFRKEALFTLFVIASDALISVVKIVVHRPRPSEPMVNVVHNSSDYSFPSGHVVHYVVFFGFLLFVIWYKKIMLMPYRVTVAALLTFLIFTVPVSRIYMGAHWLTDVVGGFLAGTVFLSIMLHFYLKDQL